MSAQAPGPKTSWGAAYVKTVSESVAPYDILKAYHATTASKPLNGR